MLLPRWMALIELIIYTWRRHAIRRVIYVERSAVATHARARRTYAIALFSGYLAERAARRLPLLPRARSEVSSFARPPLAVDSVFSFIITMSEMMIVRQKMEKRKRLFTVMPRERASPKFSPAMRRVSPGTVQRRGKTRSVKPAWKPAVACVRGRKVTGHHSGMLYGRRLRRYIAWAAWRGRQATGELWNVVSR